MIDNKIKKTKLLILDVDGVLTDGRIIWTSSAEEMKFFNVQDGVGIVLAKRAGLKVAIISARKSKVTEIRAKELKITEVHQSIESKLIAYKKLVDKYNLQNQVTLLGRLQPGVIVKEMRQARLFVLPSHMDNSPNSLAEAMLLGMPCIASNAGIPSMLKNRAEGILYNHRDINALADAMEIILGDSELASSLGARARKTAQIRHDPEKIARDTYHVYQEVLSSQ